MAYNLTEDAFGRQARPVVGNESEDGTGVWHVLTCDTDGKLKVNPTINDNDLLKLGTDADQVMLSRSTVLDANTALTSVLIGTPVSQAIAANSLMISNVTASGDIALYTNKGGNSIMQIWLDGSSGDTVLLAASGASIDHYIAGTKVLDHASGAFEFQENTTISSTGTLTLGQLEPVGIGMAAVATTGLSIDYTQTNGGSWANALNTTVTLNRTDASSSLGIAGYGITSTIGATNSQNLTAPFGLRAATLDVTITSGATGTITGAVNVLIRATISAATVTNWYGAYVEDPTGAGTITNAYGLYIASITKGATLNYSLYVAGTSYFSAITLAGTITGGSQVINTIGHIGIATASSTTIAVYLDESETITDNSEHYGASFQPRISKTSAAYTSTVYAVQGVATIGAANTQNWTNATLGAVGVLGKIYCGATSGTVTGAASFQALNTVGSGVTYTNSFGLYISNSTGAGTITNQYGVYIESLAKGGTLNYAIYCVGASVGIFAALPTTDPAVAGKWWANSGVVTVSAG